VNSAGNVTVPLLPKPIQAAGLSPDQLARALEQSFRQSGSLSRPQITVTVKQTKRSVVTVDGAVKLRNRFRSLDEPSCSRFFRNAADSLMMRAVLP